MAIVKSTAFQGSTIYDVDVTAPTFSRVWEKAQGDAALVLARLTDTAEASFIDHRGNGRGARMGINLIQQAAEMENLSFSNDVGNKNGGSGPVWWPWLCILPRGEDTFRATIAGSFLPNSLLIPTITIYTDASDLAEPSYSADMLRDADGNWNATITTAGESGLALVVVENFIGVISTMTLGPMRIARAQVRSQARADTQRANVIAPGSSALGFAQMDEALFTPSYALNAWLTSRIDQNLNGLEEFGGGWPANGNAAFTQTENGAFTPAVSRFSGPARSGFASSPIPQIPVMSLCLGGIKVGGGYLVNPTVDPPTEGALRGYAPYPLTGGSMIELCRARCTTPDIPSAAGALRWAALVGSSEIRAFSDCTVQVRMGSNTAASASPVAVTGLPSATGWLGLATGTALAHGSASVTQDLVAALEAASSGFLRADFCLLAVAVYFDP